LVFVFTEDRPVLNPADALSRLGARLASLPLHTKVLLSLATAVVLVELAFRRLAPGSAAYARWTKFFEGIGRVWTIVLLSVVYFLSVSVVSAIMKLFGKDPLDRVLQPDVSSWHAHEPNPLGPQAAARHQF
jgi:hypothetical protein